MTELILQILGGTFYLLNKAFLSFSERSKLKSKEGKARAWRIASWIVFIAGVLPWAVIYAAERNWIVFAITLSGLPVMALGLWITIQRSNAQAPRWLDYFALLCMISGFFYSIYDFGGLNTLNQWLEIATAFVSRVGIYLIAKNKASGYVWYSFTHIFTAWLVFVEGLFILFIQQILSLIFLVDAYFISRQKISLNKSN